MNEFSKESHIGTKEGRPDQQINKDYFDVLKGMRSLDYARLLPIGTTLSILMGFSNLYAADWQIMSIVGIGGAIDFVNFYKLAKGGPELSRVSARDRVSDYGLGYNATRLIYKRDVPLKVGSIELKQGNNFFYIRLPELQETESVSEGTLSALADLYDFSLRDLSTRLKDKNYKAVAIELPILFPNLGRQSNPQSTRESLLQQKDIQIKDSQRACLLLTKQELESLSRSVKEDFLRAVNALGDKKFSELTDLMLHDSGSKDPQETIRIFNNRLKQILSIEIDQLLAFPEIRVGRDEDLNMTKEKISPIIMLRETDNGYFVTRTYPKGETETLPLEDILGTKKQSLEEIIASKGHYKKAQLAFILSEIVNQEGFLEELKREENKDRESLLRRLREENIVVNWNRDPYIAFGHLAKLKKRPMIVKSVHTALTTCLMVGFLGMGVYAAEDLKNVIGQSEKAETLVDKYEGIVFNRDPAELKVIHASGIGIGETIDTDFPEGIAVGLAWKIEGDGDPRGYWITDTSYIFKDSRWKINQEEKTILTFPNSLDTKPFIQLQATVALKPFGDTSFKIPIKEGARISTIRIENQAGDLVPQQTIEMADPDLPQQSIF